MTSLWEGTSLHGMDWYKVIPLMARGLCHHGYLTIVGGRRIDTAPWIQGLNRIILEYSTNKGFKPYDLIIEL